MAELGNAPVFGETRDLVSERISGFKSQSRRSLRFSDGSMGRNRLVMAFGSFDLMHPGHLLYLERAKSLGDRLMVLWPGTGA